MAQFELLNSIASDEAPHKSEGAYKTISEVSDEIDVPQHVLRFWETHFPQVKPSRMRGGRRYYRPEDVDLLKKIKTLLYMQGYTIKGAKKAVRGEDKAEKVAQIEQPKKRRGSDVQSLVNELRILKAMLTALV